MSAKPVNRDADVYHSAVNKLRRIRDMDEQYREQAATIATQRQELEARLGTVEDRLDTWGPHTGEDRADLLSTVFDLQEAIERNDEVHAALVDRQERQRTMEEFTLTNDEKRVVQGRRALRRVQAEKAAMQAEHSSERTKRIKEYAATTLDANAPQKVMERSTSTRQNMGRPLPRDSAAPVLRGSTMRRSSSALPPRLPLKPLRVSSLAGFGDGTSVVETRDTTNELRKKSTMGERSLSALIQRKAGNAALTLNRDAVRLMNVGKQAKAKQFLDEAEQLTREEHTEDFSSDSMRRSARAATFNNYACMYKHSNLIYKALECMEACLALEESIGVQSPSTLINLGVLLVVARRYGDAVLAARRALMVLKNAAVPESPDAHLYVITLNLLETASKYASGVLRNTVSASPHASVTRSGSRLPSVGAASRASTPSPFGHHDSRPGTVALSISRPTTALASPSPLVCDLAQHLLGSEHPTAKRIRAQTPLGRARGASKSPGFDL